ncbi:MULTISPECIES: CBS domain-containing protein [Methanobacterium]|jgi:CBS domain-containing protein|nr:MULTISPECIES: CBS domain-containing protein [Methanobacterium]MBW4257855.1 CBS domain-containing protein [Methanobacterium sp. YSL]PKL71662.1 MAG: CBS domain-containing protein [Methanobacteriales archaeon HGW-Methanobacteriales-2]AUB55988.1 CBS domain-containing protein [Methanobacterium subterraneum]AUB56997.1 CBS domain-containing protein [Methanobacterium sp. MZ-A1]AUB60139.1 CBS domain-containing protein [Methanobacterium subterraneum]
MLRKLKVKDVMSQTVITVPPTEDVVFAFEKLMKYKISSLPVVDDNGKLVGIVTATDLGHNLILDKYELGTTVGEVMVDQVIYVSPEDDLATAVQKMHEYGSDEGIINQLIVLDDHKLVGIVSDGDIIRSIKI